MTTSNFYDYRPVIHTELRTPKPLQVKSVVINAAYPPAPPDFANITPRQRENAFQQQTADRPILIQATQSPNNGSRPAIAPHFNNLGVKQVYNDLPKAIRNFRAATERNNKLAPAWNNLGAAHLAVGDIEAAVEHLSQAIILDETFHIAYANRGMAYIERSAYQDAWNDFTTAFHLAPKDPFHHNNLGLIFLELIHPEEAIICFTRAIKLGTDNAAPYNNRGRAKLLMGHHKKAAADFVKAYKADEKMIHMETTP